jgi:signal transduction histidine kinase/ActR/RegA family two-component response regulator
MRNEIETAADLPGDTPIHALIRTHDWSLSPLGAPSTWPASLRSVFAMMLESQIPMSVVWGPQRVLLYNQSYVLFLGDKHPNQAFGLPIRDVWPEIWDSIGPLIERAASGDAFYLEDVPLAINRSGADEQAWFTFSYSPVRDDEGLLVGMCSAVMETSSRVLAEQRQALLVQLATTINRLTAPRETLQAAALMVAEYLGLDHVMYAQLDVPVDALRWRHAYTLDGLANIDGHASIAGLTPAALAGLMRGEPQVLERFLDADSGPSSSLVIPLQRVDKPLVLLLVRQRAMRRWTDEEIALLQEAAAYTWNAVERARAEQDLRQLTATLEQRVEERTAALERALQALRDADRHKDEFLAMLAHELRNPLAPLATAGAILKFPGVEVARLHTTADIIERQVQHMTGMVDDLLDVSRVTRGLVVLEHRDVDVSMVIEDAIEQVRPLMAARGHQLHRELPAMPCVVDGDAKRLVQIFANLLNNAAKYTPNGGDISIKAHVGDAVVSVEVSDNGIGIPADVLPYVFKLFVQGVRTADRSQGGLGIGLALVKSLAEAHGGAVRVFSAGANAGSSLVVELPLKEREASSEEPNFSSTSLSTLRNAPKRRVLIVDDNVDAATTLGLIMEHTGHLVEVENDPYQALARATAEAFDVFVLDIGMPGMDGHELARRLRRQPLSRHSVLIALTGYGQENDRDRAIDAGFDHHMTKPADIGKLMALLTAPEPAIP